MATDNGLCRIDSRNTNEAFLEDGSARKDVAGPEAFSHAPLSDNSKRIRLCKILLPQSKHGPLVISLQEHDLDAVAGDFDALSYVCGDPKGPRSSVILNERWHTITINLHTQLCKILELGWRGMLWVDALSIDPSNDAERSTQINLMNRIYGGANEVFIAIDNEINTMGKAAEDFAIIDKAVRRLAAGMHVWELGKHSPVGERSDLDGRLVHLMCRLLQSTWFTRVWCVQEVCLARKATLLVGAGFLPWETFTSAIESWRKHRELRCCSPFVGLLDPEFRKAFHQVSNYVINIGRIKAAFVSDRGQHILEPILCFQELDATQPVDNFNGYRGLHSMANLLPDADYSRPPEEFFEKVAIWSLGVYGDLTPLMLELKGGVSANMPSWVPDWSAKPPVQVNYWRWRIHFYRAYTCGTGTGRNFEYLAPGKLLMHGFEAEKVVSVAPVAFELSKVECTADHIDILKQWFSFATGRDCPETLDEIFDDDVFCDTVLGGLVTVAQKPFVRKACPPDYAQWRHDIAKMEQSTATGLFHTPLIESHVAAVVGRILFKTNTGAIGIGPRFVKPGDSLWMWNNAKSPFLTRPVPLPQSEEPQHTLLGHCYHHVLSSGYHEVRRQQSSCVLV